MIDRRGFLCWPASGLLAAPPAWSQTVDRPARIGRLLPWPEPRPSDEFLEALRELGWIEGRNLIIETRVAQSPQRQRELAAELQALHVALITAGGTTMIRAARDGAPATPIVMMNAGDALGSGFVASLARPGGNLTGTTAAGEETLAKQLELLASAAPKARQAGVLMNQANPANGFFFDALSARSKSLGLLLERLEISQEGELDAAMARAKGSLLLVLGDPVFYRLRERIAELAIAHRSPAMFGARDYVAAGGLMSYNSSYAWHARAAAGYVDKILRGAKPGELPVQQPTQFELVINLKTAKALGLTMPQSLLLRADEVIQ